MGGGGSLLQVGNTLQSIAQNIILAVTELQQLMPALTSGQMSVDTLVFTGFVRLTGFSVVAVGASPGGLYDAATIADAAAGNQAYVIPVYTGFAPVQMIFKDGLVYKPGAGEKLVAYYVRS